MPVKVSGTAGLDQLSDRGRMILLYTCCMSVFIISMDSNAVNVALPAMGVSLGASVTQLQWVISAYSLALAGFLMLSGSVADRIGRRRVFQAGLIFFALGSLLSSFAPNAEILIAARVLQGLGGSMLNPVALSIITNAFTNPAQRAKALGIWSGVIGVAMALGPPIGGLLVDLVSWRAVFWINVPIALLAVVLAALFIPESNAGTHRRLDPPGQILMIVFLVSINTALIQGGSLGWSHPLVVGCFIGALGALGVFLWWETRTDTPLLAPSLFRSRIFSVAVICALVAFASTSGFLFVINLFLQQARGLSPMSAGLLLLPLALMVAICAPASGRLVAARGPAPVLIFAGAVMALGGLLLSFIDLDSPLWYLCLAFGVYGIGFGSVNTPITNAAVSGLPKAQAGTAAAVTSTARQIGNGLGAAIFGSLVVARLGAGGPSGFEAAAQPVWWSMAGMGVVIAIAGWSVRSGMREAQAA
nr:MFS transporter [Corynebacterium occultum]